MDTTTYDLSNLDFEELLALRELQGRAGGQFDLARLTLDELLRLERLYRKMAGLPADPHEHAAPEHVAVIPDKAPDSGVTAPAESQPMARSA